MRAIGPVLCHLLDLAVRIEELCASDAYVHPHVSVVDVFVLCFMNVLTYGYSRPEAVCFGCVCAP